MASCAPSDTEVTQSALDTASNWQMSTSLLSSCLAFVPVFKPVLQQRVDHPTIRVEAVQEGFVQSPDVLAASAGSVLDGLDPALMGFLNFVFVVALSAAGAVAAAIVVQLGLKNLLPARDDEATREEFRDAANALEYASQRTQLDRIRWKQLPGPVLPPEEMEALGVQLADESQSDEATGT